MSLPPCVSLRHVAPCHHPGRPNRPTPPSPDRELPTGWLAFPSGSAHPPCRAIACCFPLISVDWRREGGPTTSAGIVKPTPYLVVRARNVAWNHPESHPLGLQKSEYCCPKRRSRWPICPYSLGGFDHRFCAVCSLGHSRIMPQPCFSCPSSEFIAICSKQKISYNRSAAASQALRRHSVFSSTGNRTLHGPQSGQQAVWRRDWCRRD